MSFHVSCEDIRIEVLPGDATYLCCAGKDVDGNWHPNRLRLDDIIGNSDGKSRLPVWLSSDITLDPISYILYCPWSLLIRCQVYR